MCGHLARLLTVLAVLAAAFATPGFRNYGWDQGSTSSAGP